MKNLILPIFALATLSTFAEKMDYVIDKASDYKTKPFPQNTVAEFDIYYTAAAGGSARMGNVSGKDHTPISLTFKGAGYTVDEMTSTNPVNWNLLGEFYFTLDATKGEQTIITNETSAYIYNQTSFISVKADSTGGSPSAFIDLGASYWVNTGGKSASAQTPGFDIQADTTIGTTAENYSEEYMVAFERRSRLNVSNNATLTIEGGTKYAYAPGGDETKTSPTINVAEGSTLYLKGAKNLVGTDVSFTVNGTLKLGDNASFETTSTALKTTINNLTTGSNVALVIGNETQINSGVTLGALTLKDTANLSIGGDITLNGAYSDSANSKLNYTGKFTYNNDSRLTINSALTTSCDFEQSLATDKGVRITNSLTLNSGADWSVDGKVEVYENATLTINEGAKLTVNAPASNAKNGRLILYKNSNVYLNAENCTSMGDLYYLKIATMNTAEVANIYVQADQKLNSFYVNNSILNLYMSDDVMLELTAVVTSWAVDGAGDGELRIHNFKEETIKVSGKESSVLAGIEKYVKLYDDNGTLLGNATLSNGWIALAVPEPAEWAMILGALALGLAVYRRRK
ncbi:MAG: PEP-CTERM sorting domain-containing protein [Opitutales bacterium]|nr:PEP-CTERM sorting domain-containing protein [Opitutales bacterium]